MRCGGSIEWWLVSAWVTQTVWSNFATLRAPKLNILLPSCCKVARGELGEFGKSVLDRRGMRRISEAVTGTRRVARWSAVQSPMTRAATAWLSHCALDVDDRQRAIRSLPPAEERGARERWGRSAGGAGCENGAAGRQIDPSHALLLLGSEKGCERGRSVTTGTRRTSDPNVAGTTVASREAG